MLTWSSWLAEVGRESTLAGWARLLFSLASAAAVTWAIMKPELSPGSATRKAGRPLMRWIGQQRDAAFGQRADLGDGDGHGIGGQRHRLGMEIAAGDDFVRVGEDQRIVGDGVDLALDDAGRVAQLVEHGAHHLGLAAQRIGILHPVVALEMGAADLAAGHELRAAPRATSIWPGWPRSCMDARIEGRIAAGRRIDAHGARHQRRGEARAAAAKRPAAASTAETWVPLSSASPSLAARSQRLQPGPGRALRRRAWTAALDAHLAHAHEGSATYGRAAPDRRRRPPSPWPGCRDRPRH